MNKEQFYSYIDNPQKLDKTSKEEIYQLVKDYPYFQSVHLLYIKNLFNQKDIKYDNQLKIASLYSTNRSALYKLLNILPDNKNDSDLHTVKSNLDFTENTFIEIPEFLTEIFTKKEIIDKKDEIFLKKSSDTIVEGNNKKEEINFKTEIEEVNSAESKIIEKKEAIADKILKRVEEQKKLRESKGKSILIAQKTETKDKNQKEKNQNIITLPDIKAENEKIEQIVIPEVNEEEKHLIVEPIINEENKQNSDLFLFTEWLEIYSEKKDIKPKSDSKNQIHLIDNFIKEEPKIRPKNISKDENIIIPENNKEGEEFITETLAMIYRKQGYYDKAIHILNKLSLKYPEKSIYFANQINEINNLINNKS